MTMLAQCDIPFNTLWLTPHDQAMFGDCKIVIINTESYSTSCAMNKILYVCAFPWNNSCFILSKGSSCPMPSARSSNSNNWLPNGVNCNKSLSIPIHANNARSNNRQLILWQFCITHQQQLDAGKVIQSVPMLNTQLVIL